MLVNMKIVLFIEKQLLLTSDCVKYLCINDACFAEIAL